jgi:hypothetical protein
VITFLVKPVDLRDGCRFVVASEDVYLVGVLDLEGEEQTDGLDALPASIHVVSQEEVAVFGGHAAVLEHSQHVVVLPVDVPAHLQRGLQLEQHWFVEHDFSDGSDDAADV